MDFYEANSQQECDMINKFIKPAEIAHCMDYACVCVYARTNNSLKNEMHRTTTMKSERVFLLLLLFQLK